MSKRGTKSRAQPGVRRRDARMDLYVLIDNGVVRHSLFALVPHGTEASNIQEGRRVRVCEFDPNLTELTGGEKIPVDHERPLRGIALMELVLENVPGAIVDQLAKVYVKDYNLQTSNCRHFLVAALKWIVQKLEMDAAKALEAKDVLFSIIKQAREENERHWTAKAGVILGTGALLGAVAVSGGTLAPAAYALTVATGGVGAGTTFAISRSRVTNYESLEATWSATAKLRRN